MLDTQAKNPLASLPTRFHLLLWFVLSLVGCSEPTPVTEVVVVIDTDLRVEDGEPTTLDEIDEIDLVITSPSGEERRAVAALGPREPALPRSLAVVHRGGRLGPFEVSAIARYRGGAALSRRARFSFEERRSRRLRVELVRECRMVTCGVEESCGRDGCVSVELPLEPWNGSTAPLTSGPLTSGPLTFAPRAFVSDGGP